LSITGAVFEDMVVLYCDKTLDLLQYLHPADYTTTTITNRNVSTAYKTFGN